MHARGCEAAVSDQATAIAERTEAFLLKIDAVLQVRQARPIQGSIRGCEGSDRHLDAMLERLDNACGRLQMVMELVKLARTPAIGAPRAERT